MITTARFILPGALFLVAAISGVLLTHSGKPLNAMILAIHKIVALVTVVLLSLAVYRLAHAVSLGTLEFVVMAAAGLVALLLFATGVWLSFDKPLPAAVLAVHKATLPLTVLATSAAVYLLFAVAGG